MLNLLSDSYSCKHTSLPILPRLSLGARLPATVTVNHTLAQALKVSRLAGNEMLITEMWKTRSKVIFSINTKERGTTALAAAAVTLVDTDTWRQS
ncbi:hypothetical protein EDB19DRAFT_1689030 [Suillus lakei]|nr:hypothetical protein EDB19DRAFT_1689030 [Suillus lakei]